MSIRICPLASGSKGNATLLRAGNTLGLIDAGLTFSALNSRLHAAGVTPEMLSFVVLTHEHDDHIAAISELATVYDIPVYANAETLRAVRLKKDVPLKNAIEIGSQSFGIDCLEFEPFSVSHDAVNPFGYSVNDGYSRISYATDLGVVRPDLLGRFKDSSVVVIESNHDKEMLLCGKYPEFLKRRIIGERGHLSNESCANLVVSLVKQGTKNVVLSHLSEENNLPELAFFTAEQALREVGADMRDAKITVAKQHSISGYIEAEGK